MHVRCVNDRSNFLLAIVRHGEKHSSFALRWGNVRPVLQNLQPQQPVTLTGTSSILRKIRTKVEEEMTCHCWSCPLDFNDCIHVHVIFLHHSMNPIESSEKPSLGMPSWGHRSSRTQLAPAKAAHQETNTTAVEDAEEDVEDIEDEDWGSGTKWHSIHKAQKNGSDAKSVIVREVVLPFWRPRRVEDVELFDFPGGRWNFRPPGSSSQRCLCFASWDCK